MIYKELYVYSGNRPQKAVIRNYTAADFTELIRVQQESFPPPFPPELWWSEEQLNCHLEHFPIGSICVEVDGILAGSMTSLRVAYEGRSDHSWEAVTDNGYIRNHDPNGETLYVVDICISPKYRKLGLGHRMMQTMYELVVHLGMKRLLGGGRMPNYQRYADRFTARQYLDRVMSGDLADPVITFMLRCGRTPVDIVDHYLEDEESGHYGVLMEWRNPFLASPTQS